MISYKPFWETLKRRDLSQYTLQKKHGINCGTFDRLRKNQNITLETINKLCRALNCPVSDIIEYIPDETADC